MPSPSEAWLGAQQTIADRQISSFVLPERRVGTYSTGSSFHNPGRDRLVRDEESRADLSGFEDLRQRCGVNGLGLPLGSAWSIGARSDEKR